MALHVGGDYQAQGDARLTMRFSVLPILLALAGPALAEDDVELDIAYTAEALAGDKVAIVAQLAQSFEKWSSLCAITYVYDGETTVASNRAAGDPEPAPLADGVSVVGWGKLDPELSGWASAWWPMCAMRSTGT